jgi:hypothetical protein
MIWNPYAIDYSEGVDIIDPVTQVIYTDEEAHKQPVEVKHRLILKGRKIGCYVMTIEEANEKLWNR